MIIPTPHRTIRRTRWLAMMVALLLSLTACSSSDEVSVDDGPSEDVAETTPADDPTSDPSTASAATEESGEPSDDQPAAPTPVAEDDPCAPGASDPTTVTVGLQTGRHGMTSGYWIAMADEFGFFDDVNITIDDVAFSSATDLLNGLTAGELDVNVMGSEGMISASQGADAIAIAGAVNASIWEPVSAPEFTTWDDLRGATVGVSNVNGVNAHAFRLMAELAGLDPETELEFVQAGATAEAFLALRGGQIDALPAAPPTNFLAAAEGFTTYGFAPEGTEVPKISSLQILTTRAWAEANDVVATCFMRALLRLIEFVEDPANREEVIDVSIPILQGGSSVVEEEFLIQAIELYIDDPVLAPYVWHDLHLPQDSFDNAMEIFITGGSIEAADAIEYEEYVDHTYLDAAIAAEG